jgi:hypothetical protein
MDKNIALAKICLKKALTFIQRWLPSPSRHSATETLKRPKHKKGKMLKNIPL